MDTTGTFSGLSDFLGLDTPTRVRGLPYLPNSLAQFRLISLFYLGEFLEGTPKRSPYRVRGSGKPASADPNIQIQWPTQI